MMAKKLLGDAVKEERLRRNLSQNALAEMVHVSLRTISDIENYNGNPRFENLCLLVSFLNLPIETVMKGKAETMDSTMKQIIAELDQCPDEIKRLALGTLRGLISAASENL
jgi:transcriptional regulator with XRE-family HTH domain